jgi:hypothetical protein
MAVATLSIATVNEIELDNRRLALESTLGSLRIEGMELESEPRQILERFANGEIDLAEMDRQIQAYTAAIV